MDKKKRSALWVLLIVALLLAACGATPPTSTSPPPTPAPIPTTAAAGPAQETALEPMTTEYSVIHRNIPYVPGGDFQQKLSVYLPLEEKGSPGGRYPVVVLAHGYTRGKDDPLLAETMRFLNQLGYAAITIDYRDDDENGNPWAAHNDGACALAWIYANADTYGLDVDRMAAFGNSYGAQVVSDLALAEDPNVFITDCPHTLPNTRPFRGVIPFGADSFGVPGEGLSIPSQVEADIAVRLLHTADTVEEMMAIHDALAKLPPAEWATADELSQEARAYAQTLPAYWVDASDPPFLLLFPGQDGFGPQLEYDAFAGLLEDAGVSFTYLVLPDAGHTTWGPYGQTDPASWQEPIREFLEAVLAGEPTATQPLDSPEWPSARKYGDMVYDPLSERIFMIGGVKGLHDDADIPEVWAYEPAGNRWQERGTLGPRVVISAALDEESQRVIVFGRTDTWAYDSADDSWKKMDPASMPSVRWASQMVYDAESDRIVFFGGGTDAFNSFGDTWVYDHNTDAWTEMQPDASPPARAYHGMDYDPQNDRVLLWGGHTLPGESDLRVWAYDYNTNTWTTQEAPSNAPEQRNGLGLFYHAPSGRMIVYGGLTEDDGQLVEGATWAYDYGTNSWQALAPSQSPGQRAHAPMAYAPSVDKAILFGGELTSKTADDISDETWIFDPAADEWQNVDKP